MAFASCRVMAPKYHLKNTKSVLQFKQIPQAIPNAKLQLCVFFCCKLVKEQAKYKKINYSHFSNGSLKC